MVVNNRWRKFHFNITGQFILYMACISVIPLLIVGAFAYSVSYSIIHKEALRNTAELVNDQKDYLDVLLQEVDSLMANVSGVEEVTNVLFDPGASATTYNELATQAKIGYILNNYINLKGLVSIDIYISNGTHYHVGDTLQVDHLNETARQQILEAAQKSNGNTIWTGIEDNINAESAYRKVVTAAKMINRADPQTGHVEASALLVVNYSPAYLKDHFAKIQMGQGAYLAVIDTQGRIIYHPNTALLGSKLNSGFMKQMEGANGTFEAVIDNQNTLVSFTHSENSNWTVASFIPVDNLTAQTIPIATTTLLVLGICFIGVAILGLRYNRTLVSPVRQITETFKRFEKGGLDLTTRLDPGRKDEIGELAHWFNEFLRAQAEKQATEAALSARQQHLTLLNEISLAALGTPNLEGMVRTLGLRIRGLFQADGCFIILFASEDPDVPMQFWGPEGLIKDSDEAAVINMFPPELVDSEKPIFIAEARTSSWIDLKLVSKLNAGSILVLPLQTAEKKLGIALIVSQELRTFTDEEIRSGEQVARQISLALAKAYLLEEIQHRAQVFETLYETAHDLAKVTSIPELMKNVLARTASLLSSASGFIYLYDSKLDDLYLAEEQNLPWEKGTRLAIGEGMAGQVALQRIPISVENYSKWEHRSEQYIQYGVGAVAAVPMIWGEDLIGVLGVTDETRMRGKFTDSDIRILSLLARLATSGVNNMILLEELRRVNERLAFAMHTKDEFLANMSHEIRTPINGVIGMTGLLLSTELTGEQQHFTDTIEVSATSLLAIINDILDYSKIEAGKLEIAIAEFDLVDLIREIGEVFAYRAQEKGLELICDLSPDLEGKYLGDVTRIRQIINNLVGNAIKFTSKGEILISVVPVSNAEKRKIRFSVMDSGIGIANDKIDYLFQPFIQADATTTRNFGGSGLGLSISKKLIDLMGGEIGVESEPGQGSNFWFTMPLEPIVEINPAQPAQLLSTVIPRALVVDNGTTSREITVKLLQEKGFSTTRAESGEKALEAVQDGQAKEKPYQLIIINFPQLGSESTNLVQTFHNSASDQTKIMVMTSILEKIGETWMTQLGISCMLKKPIQRRQLFQAIDSLFLPERRGGNTSLGSQSEAALPNLAGLRVLLAEDNPINQDLAQTILEKKGVIVETVNNGAEAIEALRQKRFDVVLMDIQMPVLDGLEATREIRRSSSGVLDPQVPIIAMTANAMRSDQENCLTAGMNDYLSKPFNNHDLFTKLAAWSQSPPPVDLVPGEPSQIEPIEVKSDFQERELRPPEAGLDGIDVVQVIQFDELCHRVMDDRVKAISLLKKANIRLELDLQTLRDAERQSDRAQIKSLAHLLKGSGGNLSAEALRSAAECLEMNALEGDWGDIHSQGEALARAIVDFRQAAQVLIADCGINEALKKSIGARYG